MRSYQFQIEKTIEALDEVETILFTRMLNLASEGELKEITENFEIGEEVFFKLEDLQNLEDPNIVSLMSIFNDVLSLRYKLENLYPNLNRKKEDNDLPF
jgi:hypothetical protein